MKTRFLALLAGFLLAAFPALAPTPADLPTATAAAPTATPPRVESAGQPIPRSASSPLRPDSGTELAQTISQITGVAISPLLGTGAVGAWRYLQAPADQRHRLPWFAQPWFWIPALLLVALVAAKDSLGPVTPAALKKPIDVAEVVENKISGLIAVGAFVPLVVHLANVLGAELPGVPAGDSGPGASAAFDPAAAGLAAATASPLVNTLLTPFAMIAFVAVWLLGHVVHVLILISPFTSVDTALKLLRTTLLATVVGTSFAGPWIGAAWALVIIVVGIVLAGWSFRLTCLGSVFLFDLLSRRRRRFRPDPAANWMFLSRDLGDAPLRSYGRFSREPANEAGVGPGALRFRYRPFLLGREREVTLPEGDYCVGRGFVYPDLLRLEGDDTRRFGILPPRYRGHEDDLTRIYRLAPPRDVGIRAVWTALKELLGLGAATSAGSPGREAPASGA